MATTIKQVESEPESYSAAPSGLSTAAAALDAAMIWQRIEAFTARRFTARAIVWTVEGPGEWIPPLAPATIEMVEQWVSGAWDEVSLSASPMGGYCLPSSGLYRFTGTVGVGPVPAAVAEAYRRLAEYMAARPGKAGAAFESVSAGSVSMSVRRDPAWLAMAMQNSGAGDLLRPYRRAA